MFHYGEFPLFLKICRKDRLATITWLYLVFKILIATEKSHILAKEKTTKIDKIVVTPERYFLLWRIRS